MPKWKGSYDSDRKYNKSWEGKYVWVRRASDGSESAFCKLCKIQIAPKSSRLADHEKSKGHSSRVNASSMCRALPVMTVQRKQDSDNKKRLELEFVVTISCHCVILSVDHVGEWIKMNGKGSELENLQVHRTKCSKLISRVIAPAYLEELKGDVKGKKYSMLVDEATDIATTKHLCVVLRYYSEIRSTLVTDFCGLVPIVGGTGQEMFFALNSAIEKMGLKWSDCVGFGSDGASSMIGEHNSVWSRVREQAPNCQLNRCVCHSLALCIEKAFDKMPSNIGYLVHEIPKWFSKSTVRRDAFKELFKVMDANEERKGTPLPFQKVSNTRWLVRGKVIYNILVNWEELKAYFACAIPLADMSCRYKAREILGMLEDPINLLYFHFVSPIVTEFEKVNSVFQMTNADPVELVRELAMHHKTLKHRLIDRNGKELPIDKVDYGTKFMHELSTFVNRQDRSTEAVGKANEVRGRCFSVLTEALKQVEKRLPPSAGIYKGLSAFAPRNVLSQTDRVPYKELPLPYLRREKEDVIEQQYRKILHLPWSEESVFNGNIPTDTLAFWSGILQYKDSSGRRSFEELANYAMACLTTPTSNAVVERIFSTLTSVKTKSRNRLSTEMLDAIIRIRSHLSFQGKCCRDFKATPRMLELFNSANLYGKEGPDDDDIMDVFAHIN